ncbi:hypothetical protein [Micromonospora sp. NPDC004704]
MGYHLVAVIGGTALHRLGVVRGEHDDEFAAVGLGRHRDLDDWLDSATGPHDQ